MTISLFKIVFIVFLGLSFVFILVQVQRLLTFLYFRYSGNDRYNCRKIAVVGSFDRAEMVTEILDNQLSWGHEVVGRIDTGENGDSTKGRLGSITDLPHILRHHAIDDVVFALGNDRSINLPEYLDICRKMGVCCRILPLLWQNGECSLYIDSCQEAPFLTMQTHSFSASGLMYKRILDLLGGTIGTGLFLLVYPVVGLAIKLDSPGPVLFKQKRVGQKGRFCPCRWTPRKSA